MLFDSQLLSETKVIFIPRVLKLRLKRTLMNVHQYFLVTEILKHTKDAEEKSPGWKSSIFFSTPGFGHHLQLAVECKLMFFFLCFESGRITFGCRKKQISPKCFV